MLWLGLSANCYGCSSFDFDKNHLLWIPMEIQTRKDLGSKSVIVQSGRGFRRSDLI